MGVCPAPSAFIHGSQAKAPTTSDRLLRAAARRVAYGIRLITFLILDLILCTAVGWPALQAGVRACYRAITAATAISRCGWCFTIGIVALSVLLAVRSQRQLMAVTADAPAGQDGR